MLKFEKDEKRLEESSRNMRKLILIENLDELNFKKKKRDRFISFYYDNLRLNLLDALDMFKKL